MKFIRRNVKLRFPFNDLTQVLHHHDYLQNYFLQTLNCNPSDLPGHELFSVSKRYIRAVSPSLWEESERMVLSLAVLINVGLLIGSIIFMLSGRSFEEFSGMG